MYTVLYAQGEKSIVVEETIPKIQILNAYDYRRKYSYSVLYINFSL